jgi:hypothetical protein
MLLIKLLKVDEWLEPSWIGSSGECQDAPAAAVQVDIVNLACVCSISVNGGLIQTTSG